MSSRRKDTVIRVACGSSHSRRTLSSCFRNAMKSAHSCTLSNEFKHFSTCWVYFLYFGSAAYAGGVDATGSLSQTDRYAREVIQARLTAVTTA